MGCCLAICDDSYPEWTVKDPVTGRSPADIMMIAREHRENPVVFTFRERKGIKTYLYN